MTLPWRGEEYFGIDKQWTREKRNGMSAGRKRPL